MSTDLFLPSGIVLQFDKVHSKPACHLWHTTFGSVTMHASHLRMFKPIFALELQWPSGLKIATGADFAECEHRLFSKLIPYRVSVEIAEACVQREWAA